jgi:hypothetical protein
LVNDILLLDITEGYESEEEIFLLQVIVPLDSMGEAVQ